MFGRVVRRRHPASVEAGQVGGVVGVERGDVLRPQQERFGARQQLGPFVGIFAQPGPLQ